MSRREIEGLIAEGRMVFIDDGYVLKVDGWLPYHPGGDHAIMHMVGRDATDEVNAYVHLLFIAFVALELIAPCSQLTLGRSSTDDATIPNRRYRRTMEELCATHTRRSLPTTVDYREAWRFEY
jgi:hypothetical protein